MRRRRRLFYSLFFKNVYLPVPQCDCSARVRVQAMYTRAWEHTAHSGAVASVRFSPDGLLVASASADGTAALAAAASPASGGGSGGTAGGAVLAQLRGHTGGLSDCAWSVDGDWLATASDDAAVKLWDVATVRARARNNARARAARAQRRVAANTAQRNRHPHSPAARPHRRARKCPHTLVTWRRFSAPISARAATCWRAARRTRACVPRAGAREARWSCALMPTRTTAVSVFFPQCRCACGTFARA